jgi:hypothetical protein
MLTRVRIELPHPFTRCPRCNVLHGSVPACPNCGWAKGCAWCQKRVWVHREGWVWSPSVYPEAESHGACPWCAAEWWHCNPAVVDVAARRLGCPPGLITVHRVRLIESGRYLRVGYRNKTGWAGIARPTTLF